jgi:hypothetical protein
MKNVILGLFLAGLGACGGSPDGTSRENSDSQTVSESAAQGVDCEFGAFKTDSMPYPGTTPNATIEESQCNQGKGAFSVPSTVTYNGMEYCEARIANPDAEPLGFTICVGVPVTP